MIRTIILICGFMLLATAAVAEYYQYTDQSGNLRYTDDISQVPEDQKPAMKTFKSEKKVSNEPADEAPLDENDLQPSEPSEPERMDAGGKTDQPDAEEQIAVDFEEGTLAETAAELDRIQAELNNTRAELEAERAEIKAQAPKKNAKSQERIEYSAKIQDLNNRITQYEEDLKTFEKRVNAFNNSRKITGKK
ncbi:MAG: DUF4124 domain-containing protein [Desulfobacterales bacterium]|nr:DUF4124 domain-containing protein [Desulfobacterales bacterium]